MIITDERYYVVEEAICDAFMQLIEVKEIYKITVSDIIKKAGIVRSTFYNHYENIPALIKGIESKTISDIFTMLEKFHPKNDYNLCFSFYKTICEYIKTNPLLSGLLIRPEGNEFFEKVLKMFHDYVKSAASNLDNPSVSSEEYAYIIACTIGGTIGILHKWTKDQFNAPVDFVADILTKSFIASFLPNNLLS